jgi:hypothetical protein
MSARPLLLLFLAVPVLACGGTKEPKTTCNPPTSELTAKAVGPYVKSLDPLPARFLVTEGTDSSLEAVGQQALMKAGPVRILPPSKADQEKLRTMLKAGGSWTTLLVSGGAYKLVDDSTASVSLRGTYLWFGEKAGQAAPAKEILFACRNYNWVLKEPASTVSSTKSGDSTVLTAEDLVSAEAANLHDAVDKLRPKWMTGGRAGNVAMILFNDAPATKDDLKNTLTETIAQVRYIRGDQAVGKWGDGAKYGILLIRTK